MNQGMTNTRISRESSLELSHILCQDVTRWLEVMVCSLLTLRVFHRHFAKIKSAHSRRYEQWWTVFSCSSTMSYWNQCVYWVTCIFYAHLFWSKRHSRLFLSRLVSYPKTNTPFTLTLENNQTNGLEVRILEFITAITAREKEHTPVSIQ